MKRLCGSFLAVVFASPITVAAPKGPDEKPGPAVELHVVAVHEGAVPPGVPGAGATASVAVDRPGADVILLLSSYNSVTWTVTVSPKTTLKKVILGGYHRQAAVVPKGTAVEDMFHDDREGREYLYIPYKLESARFRPAVQIVRAATGQDIKSYHGRSRFNPADPITVNGVHEESRLSSKYPTLTGGADLPKVKFQAARLVTVDRFRVSGSFGDFTQDGPVKDSLKPLPDGIVRLVQDPKGKKYYGLTNHEIHEVDLEKRKSVKLDPGVGLARVSRPKAITFDTKRDRLLVVASKFIYEYAPATGKWGVIAELPRGTDLAAMAYHAKDDTLYAVGHEIAGEDDTRPALYRLNAQGAILKSTPLTSPVFPSVLGRYGMDGDAQLVSTGTHLAMPANYVPRDGNGRLGKAESFLFLIDPADDDKVTLGWKE